MAVFHVNSADTAQKLPSRCNTEPVGAGTLVFMISITLEEALVSHVLLLQKLILSKIFFSSLYLLLREYILLGVVFRTLPIA